VQVKVWLLGTSPMVWRRVLVPSGSTLRELHGVFYEYDLNIPSSHGVRIEDRQQSEVGKAYPACIGGSGACPPEDGGGPAAFMAAHDGMLSLNALEDLETMAEIIGQVALDRRPEVLRDAMAAGVGRRAQPGTRVRRRAAILPAGSQYPPAELPFTSAR
jgi:Plasmid pRiA4b ORF-3-like protein